MKIPKQIVSYCAFGILLLNVQAQQREVPAVFHPSSNGLAAASRDGAVALWFPIVKNLSLGGTSIPLRIGFGSRQNNCKDSCLGLGWWFPLLESSVVELYEGCIEVMTPGGARIRVYEEKSAQKTFSSLDQKWTAELAGDTFLVHAHDGWDLKFVKGYLVQMTDVDHGKVNFHRKNGRVEEVTVDGNNVLGLAYDKEGHLRTLSYPGHVLELEMLPAMILSGDGLQLGKAVAKISEKQKELMSFLLKPTGDLNSLMMTASGDEQLWQWDSAGTIESDSKSTYHIDYVKEGEDAVIQRTLKSGEIESYAYDSGTGTQTTTAANGVTLSRRYVLTPGAAYGRLWSEVVANVSGDKWERQKYYYDKNGSVLRSVIKLSPSQQSEKYFENGRLIKQIINNQMTEFKVDEGVVTYAVGSVSKSIKNGRLVIESHTK
ncbi:MAG: hypothetical protein B7Z37_06685 [Verrucomicrobia bacterium 12-59-8]|nr:MAG: hypothetical protein B7Z37_06685 [Verrucomicrobia bacterium 12-59-8]